MNLFRINLLIIIVIIISISACQHESLIVDEEITVDPVDTLNNNNNQNVNNCDPDSIYFVNDVMPILQSNCAFSGCHGDGSAKDGVDLTSYSSIINTADVDPFDPDGSDLYEVLVEDDVDDIMPPPPANSLTSDQISIIAKWINQGALMNSCNNCDTSNVTFSQEIFPLIQNNCQGCHNTVSPNGGIELSNYDQISMLALNGTLYGTIDHLAGYVPMPYNQNKLDQCQVDKVRIWAEQGALDN